MSKRDKLLQRFLLMPRDFTWQELVRLMSGFGYSEDNAGATSGSRVRFTREGYPPIILHRPHPTPVLKLYQIEQIIEVLKNEGML